MPAVVQVLATVEETNVFGQTTPGVAQGSGVFFHEDGSPADQRPRHRWR